MQLFSSFQYFLYTQVCTLNKTKTSRYKQKTCSKNQNSNKSNHATININYKTTHIESRFSLIFWHCQILRTSLQRRLRLNKLLTLSFLFDKYRKIEILWYFRSVIQGNNGMFLAKGPPPLEGLSNRKVWHSLETFHIINDGNEGSGSSPIVGH